MSFTKQQLRDAVRSQLDVDEEEFDNTKLDLYLGEAFQRTIAVERKWPFLEHEWTDLVFTDGEPQALPNDLAEIESVYAFGMGQMTFLSHGFAEEQFGRDGTVGNFSTFFSLRNQKIYPWPAAVTDVEYMITGWRKPTSFFNADAGTAPDCDERLHSCLIWYACALAQAANEEDVYDSIYYSKWKDAAQSARDDIMRPAPGRRRILNAGLAKVKGRMALWGN